ncbi:MAG: S1 family peptidase, partial [Firmicutes bacterium]|nr:S1 family peptidase [Bacillota bacterium]
MKKWMCKLLTIVVLGPVFLVSTGFGSMNKEYSYAVDGQQIPAAYVASGGFTRQKCDDALQNLDLIEPNFLSMPRNNIHAGKMISYGICLLNPYGSIGAKATCNITGNRGILTAGHVVLGNASLSSGLPEFTPPIIGFSRIIGRIRDEEADRWHQVGGNAHSAFVPFFNQNAWNFTSSASYGGNVVRDTYVITHREEIRENMPVVKFGARTGRTEGIVTHVSMLEFTTTSGRVHNHVIRTTAGVDQGDSGGPLFAIIEGRYVLIGIIFAGDAGRSYASNILNVQERLNVRVEATPSSQIPRPLQRGRYEMLVPDTLIHLHGNDTTFNVHFHQANGSQRTVNFEGRGTTTRITSRYWNAALSDRDMNLNGRSISFVGRVMNSMWFGVGDTMLAVQGLADTITIEVISIPAKLQPPAINTISGNLINFTPFWTQPTFTSHTNPHGQITQSGHAPGRPGWGAFDGWIGQVSVGNAAGFPAAQWTK